MKYLVTFFLVVALAATGCTQSGPPLALAKKEALRKILDAEFVLTSFPKEKEEELYRLLEVFAADRIADEFVRSVDFPSRDSAEVSFSNSGFHGGGIAKFKKKNGRWIADKKWYYL